jgi:hypothetical protein
MKNVITMSWSYKTTCCKNISIVKDFEPYVQHSIFEKYFGHVLLKNVVPKYIFKV